jgi:hypothetical protein
MEYMYAINYENNSIAVQFSEEFVCFYFQV